MDLMKPRYALYLRVQSATNEYSERLIKSAIVHVSDLTHLSLI